jgi:hypothetical protein
VAASPLPDERLLDTDPVKRGEKADVAMAIELLEAGGCSVWRLANQSMDRYFFWFVLEHYLESRTIERVDASRLPGRARLQTSGGGSKR